MFSLRKISFFTLLTGLLVAASSANASDSRFFASLSGFQEVPAVLSDGSGFFRARVNRDNTIDFVLKVDNLSGIFAASHIHFAQKGVNGGVMVTLCGGPPTAAVPACSDVVRGTINAENVGAGAASQGIPAGDLEAVIKALRSGNTYINVHTSAFPSGELRGRVR
ncbi:CHRD domain-containing protein [Aurantivibrio infirmus]